MPIRRTRKKCRILLAPTFHLSRITFCLWLLFLGFPDMGIVDNYHSLFTFSSNSWVVLIWLVSLPLQLLRSLTGKTTDSSPGCCCGRYRSLTSKATASVVDGCQSCFVFDLHSWAVLTWAVSLSLQSLRSLTNKTTASVWLDCSRWMSNIRKVLEQSSRSFAGIGQSLF